MSHARGKVSVSWRTPGLLGWLALALLLFGLIFTGMSGKDLVFAWLEKGVGDGDRARAEQEQRLGQYEADTRSRVAQVQGRSLFFVPPSPEQLAQVDEPEPEPEPDPDPGPPPAPTRYGGPAVIAVVNNSVWISSGTMIPVGEEAEGVRVVNVDNAPWSVRLEWRAVEFDVPLFERTTPRFLQASESTNGS